MPRSCWRAQASIWCSCGAHSPDGFARTPTWVWSSTSGRIDRACSHATVAGCSVRVERQLDRERRGPARPISRRSTRASERRTITGPSRAPASSPTASGGIAAHSTGPSSAKPIAAVALAMPEHGVLERVRAGERVVRGAQEEREQHARRRPRRSSRRRCRRGRRRRARAGAGRRPRRPPPGRRAGARGSPARRRRSAPARSARTSPGSVTSSSAAPAAPPATAASAEPRDVAPLRPRSSGREPVTEPMLLKTSATVLVTFASTAPRPVASSAG